MTVFKAYMKIAKKNLWLLFMYMGIFFLLTIVFQGAAQKSESEGYQSSVAKIGIVDEDGDILAESLIRTLQEKNEVLLLSGDQEELQESLFYRGVDYIVWIPQDFAYRCVEGNEKLKVTTVPGTFAGSYAEQAVNSFIHTARSYWAAGFSDLEIAEAAVEQPETEVTLMDFTGNKGEEPAYVYYYRYLPFLLLSVICYMMGYILMGFSRGHLPERMRASAIPAKRQTAEGLLAAGVISLGVWTMSTAAVFLLYGRQILAGNNVGYYILNSISLLAVSLTLAYLIGTLVKDSNALSGIVNIAALGMCFVCGTFVEMDYLSPAVKKAAQFLPVYWYETVNNLLAGYGTISGDVRIEVFQGIGIQLVFAAAFACVTLAVSRKRA